jgi:predicted secreted protein
MRKPEPTKDIRSKRCVFVAHCVLAQCIRAEGVARHSAASIKPVLQFCLDHDINIFQLPCPETQCAAGGLGRAPHGKVWYEKHGLREVARRLAAEQVQYMKALAAQDFNIRAIIGIDFSPACAVNYINRGPVIIKERGIFVEELARELKEAHLKIPFIGINEHALKKLEGELGELI